MATKNGRDPLKAVSLSQLDPKGKQSVGSRDAVQGNTGDTQYKGLRSPMMGNVPKTNAIKDHTPNQNAFGEEVQSQHNTVPLDQKDPFAGSGGPKVLAFRAPSKTSRRTPWIASLLIVVGSGIYLETMEPELAQSIHHQVKSFYKETKQQIPLFVNPDSKRSTTKEMVVDTPLTTVPRTAITKKAFDPLRLGCDKILAMQKTDDPSLNSKFFQVSAECSFAQLDYVASWRQSETAMKQYRKTAEATSSELWLMRARSLLAMGMVADTERMLGTSCERWSKTAPCVAKLHILTRKGNLEAAQAGFSQLERLPMAKGSRLDVDLFVAAANLASASGQYDSAESRLQTAVKYAPEDSPFAWKEIYEARVWNAARKGDPVLASKILKDARSNVFVDPKSLGAKLSLISSLSQPDNSKLNAYFLDTKMPRSRVVDLEFFEALSYEAIRRNLVNTYLPYHSAMKKNLIAITELGKSSKTMMTLLESRALLSQSKPDKSYQMLNTLQGSPTDMATAAMLRGIALQQMASNDQYTLFALTEFLESYRQQPSWQALWAAGQLYSVVHQPAKAKPITSKIRQDFKTNKDAMAWVNMLEFRISSLSLPPAQGDSQIDAVLAKRPNHPYLWQVKVDYLQQTKRFDQWRILDKQLLQKGLLTSNTAHPDLKMFPMSALVLAGY